MSMLDAAPRPTRARPLQPALPNSNPYRLMFSVPVHDNCLVSFDIVGQLYDKIIVSDPPFPPAVAVMDSLSPKPLLTFLHLTLESDNQ
jgi:hypothetical protein